jgi:hypothetical protein
VARVRAGVEQAEGGAAVSNLPSVRVVVVDAAGEGRPVIGSVEEFAVPEGFEWPTLPEIGEDGRSHHMEIVAGDARCLPECWCQS